MDSDNIIQIVDEDEQKELCEDYGIELIEKIDEGSFGVVFKGRDTYDDSLCAVKVTQSFKEKYSGIETSILRDLCHPNIVKFKKLDQNKYIVMEYIGCGTLFQLIEDRKQQKQPFTEQEICTIMTHLISALKYMHENNVLHRDIKPENILLGSRDDLTKLKLSDFGLSAKYKDGVTFKSYSEKCGTVIFMAPEILQEKQYSKPVDLWSCGIIFYMLFSMGKHPFKQNCESREEYTKKLINMDITKENFDDIFPSDLAKDLFFRMVNKDPSYRYTASQVLKHPFITRKLNSSIPLSLFENAKVFQNERKLLQTIKAMLVLKLIQQKSMNHQELKNKIQKSKYSPIKYKTQVYFSNSDKESIQILNTGKSMTFESKNCFQHESNEKRGSNNDILNDGIHVTNQTIDLNQLTEQDDFTSRSARVNLKKFIDPQQYLHRTQLSQQNLTQKTGFLIQETKQEQKNNLKTQNTSPVEQQQHSTRDEQTPVKKNNVLSINQNSKFYLESPVQNNQRTKILPSISQTYYMHQPPAFLPKKDISQLSGMCSPMLKQRLETSISQKFSSHGNRILKINQKAQSKSGNTSMKANSSQKIMHSHQNYSNVNISNSSISCTNKQFIKSTQNFQIKVVTPHHNNYLNLTNNSVSTEQNCEFKGGECGQNNTIQSYRDIYKINGGSGVSKESERQQKQIPIQKQSNNINYNRQCTTPISGNTSKYSSSVKMTPKQSLQIQQYSLESTPPELRQNNAFKSSSFVENGIKDNDSYQLQTNFKNVIQFQNFHHNQRILIEKRRVNEQIFDGLQQNI